MANNNELEEYTVIIDIGEAFVKVGFAGDEKPTSIFPTVIGKPKFKHVMQTTAEDKEIYVGNDCMNKRGVMKISYPISRGNVMDWDSYYAILTHIFYNELRIDPSKANILYAENCLTPIETRQFIARLFFETYKCRSVYIASSPILALFSAGLTTGITVEIGEGLTRIVPIIDGRVIQHAVQRLSLAGIDVNENLKTLLLQNGINISGTSALREILREIKEKNCFIALDPEKVSEDSKEITNFILPDGEKVNINMEIRVRAPEILFHPEILGLPVDNVPQGIISALNRIDRSYWRTMMQNIVLTGGTSLFPGIELRLHEEIEKLLPQLGKFPKPEMKSQFPPPKPKMVNIAGPVKIKDSCPNCGEIVNLQESIYCPKCGVTVSESKIEITSLQSTEYPNKCPKCKKKLKKDSEFCPYCGEKLTPEIISSRSNLKPIEVSPQFDSIRASEFEESESFVGIESDRPIIKIVTPERRETAIFNGASILGSLKSFKKLFVSYKQFLENPNSINLDFSQIL